MRSRVARVLVGALLLAVAIAAALQFRFLLDQARQQEDAHTALLTQLAGVDAAAADLATAQAAYIAPGQPDAPWIERVEALSQQLTDSIAAMRPNVRSAAAGTHLQAIADSVARLVAADTIAREFLRQENDLAAADTVFNEARDAIGAARAATADLAAAERSSYDAERAGLQQQLMMVPGAALALALLGVALLIPRPRIDAAVSTNVRLSPELPPEPIEATPPVAPSVDLAAAADLCADLSRVVSSAALPDMLARAAALLDASGVIVWMGSGDELIAVTAHGYNPAVIRRLGAIPRDADNATAAAWRTGEVRTVASDAMSNGAIVAPMFGPDSCIGVLAVEVRHGREQDASTQAVTMMVAAQLAAVLGAWPAASAAHAAKA